MASLSTWAYTLMFAALVTTQQRTEQIALAPPKSNSLDSGVSKVQNELKKAEIFPTVIDEFLPSLLLDVEWTSGEEASLGNTLKVDKVQDQPSFTVRRDPASSSLHMEESDVTYTITITDPDAPSRNNPKWSEFCHFIATGIHVSSSAIITSSFKDIIPYQPPGPPPKTGKHRYVFLLFAPANGTTDSLNLSKPSDRKHWGTGKERHGVRDWASENDLRPVAANFIYAQNEQQ
ncbi:PEBP-like protein [Whalleya microplaca]|nr:PEBP-like protein [Whalleya microplaca]